MEGFLLGAARDSPLVRQPRPGQTTRSSRTASERNRTFLSASLRRVGGLRSTPTCRENVHVAWTYQPFISQYSAPARIGMSCHVSMMCGFPGSRRVCSKTGFLVFARRKPEKADRFLPRQSIIVSAPFQECSRKRYGEVSSPAILPRSSRNLLSNRRLGTFFQLTSCTSSSMRTE